MKYKKWYLNLALILRKKVRNLTFNSKLTQYGRLTRPFVNFLDTLFDIKHQETFKNTIENKYAREDERIRPFIDKISYK